MAKARPCPICSNFFNPKFGGKQMGQTIICKDCFVSKLMAERLGNTPKPNRGVARNQANHSVN